jgi:hypothetical protein
MFVVVLGLREFPQRKTFLGKRGAVGNRVGELELIGEQPVASFRIDPADDAPAYMLALRTAEPFRQELDQHIGEGAEAGQEQDHETPRPKPTRLRCMDDESHVDEEQDYAKWDGKSAAGRCRTFMPPA